MRSDTTQVRLLYCLVANSLLGVCAHAQINHKSYSDFYNKSLSHVGMNAGTNAYLYDKYFYKSPAISPYINLGRLGSDSADSYHLYVRPELERRDASRRAHGQYIQQRKLQGNVGYTSNPGAFANGGLGTGYRVPTPNVKRTAPAYHNHWYGGWNNR